MKFTGNFEKMGKIMYRRIFVHHINFYRLENNMKLVSWNVNGIRACITKGFEESFAKLDADIFCLQETKCQENQVKLELPGYYQYWNYANRKGYSGTAVFTKKEPLSVTYGLGIEEHDKEGRVITAEMDDFYLVTVYTPNSQSELRRLEYRMEWERDFLQQQSQGVDIEFGNFLEIYYKDMDVRLRENTMYTKRYIIDLKIKPYFEKKILSEITVADVRAWQNELLTYKDKNGKGYSPTYLKTVNCQLTAIFNYAMRYYNLQDNPCRKAGAIGKSKGEPKDFWMQEEFNAFLETVSDKPETRMAFLLLYWTGMRIGELLALTYNDINLEEKTISINKSYQRLKGKDMITQPKTPKSIRVITMPDFLAEEFREYCSHLYGIMKKERLFRFTKSHMEHCMATGIERSGVKRIRLHDLRHSHASMLVDMGVAPLEIAERLGHEKVETTLNTYSHLYPSTQSKLAGLLDKKHEEEEE